MKYNVAGVLGILINYRLTKIEDVFICYSSLYQDWMIISKFLHDLNHLKGYIISRQNGVISFRILTFSFTSLSGNYVNETYRKFATERDFMLSSEMIGKINYAISRQDLRAKHLAAINAKESVMRF